MQSHTSHFKRLSNFSMKTRQSLATLPIYVWTVHFKWFKATWTLACGNRSLGKWSSPTPTKRLVYRQIWTVGWTWEPWARAGNLHCDKFSLQTPAPSSPYQRLFAYLTTSHRFVQFPPASTFAAMESNGARTITTKKRSVTCCEWQRWQLELSPTSFATTQNQTPLLVSMMFQRRRPILLELTAILDISQESELKIFIKTFDKFWQIFLVVLTT